MNNNHHLETNIDYSLKNVKIEYNIFKKKQRFERLLMPPLESNIDY